MASGLGKTPQFRLKIPAPAGVLFVFVLVIGGLLSLMLYDQAQIGGYAAQGRFILSVIATVLASFLILLGGTSRWWFRHLRNSGNSQRLHKERIKRQRRRAGRDFSIRQLPPLEPDF
jgi:hypothetical protein